MIFHKNSSISSRNIVHFVLRIKTSSNSEMNFRFYWRFFFEFEHLLKKSFSYDHYLKLNRMERFLILKILIKNKKNHCVSVICRFWISFDLFFDFVLSFCVDFWLSDWCYHQNFFQKRKITECWFNENWFFQNRKKITRYIWMC